MRQFIILIAIGALAYLGWQKWREDPKFFTKYFPNSGEAADAPAEADSTAPSTPAPASGSVAPLAAVVPATPAPRPFVSKIVVPPSVNGEKPMMPPGQFLILERTSVETKDGVIAVVPGDSVKLLERRNNGTVQVTDGQFDFVLKQGQVTQDFAVAQEAERRDFERRYGTRR